MIVLSDDVYNGPDLFFQISLPALREIDCMHTSFATPRLNRRGAARAFFALGQRHLMGRPVSLNALRRYDCCCPDALVMFSPFLFSDGHLLPHTKFHTFTAPNVTLCAEIDISNPALR